MIRRWLRRLVAATALAGLAWGGGFVWFVRTTSNLGAAVLPEQVDGIIALTGGAGRVELALRLLEQGRGDKLLISGVGRAEFADLARRAGVALTLAPRVTLGRMATSTRGNAIEAAEWARGAGIRRAIVVTSAYHMPRALAELSSTLPDVVLLPVPVLPGHDGALSGLRLLAVEYTKLLAVQAGLSRFAAREEPAR